MKSLRLAPVAAGKCLGGSRRSVTGRIADLLRLEHRVAGLERLEHVIRAAGLAHAVRLLDEPADVAVGNGRREELVDARHDVLRFLPAFLAR